MDSRFTWCVDNVPIEGKSKETTGWVGNLHIEENSIVLRFLCKLKRFTHVSSDFEVLLIEGTPYLETEKPMEKDDIMRFPSPLLGQFPLDNLDGYFVFKERMMQALRHFKDMTEQNVLAQIWAPVKDGSRYVLTTSGQPFLIGTLGNGLHQFRAASVMYKFAVSEDGALGLPGRVFRQKFPEWTPNVQYYSCKEYPRRVHAQCFNVQGSLALPVFEPSGQSCVGVVELIMNSSKINYAPEVDKVCKALEVGSLFPFLFMPDFMLFSSL